MKDRITLAILIILLWAFLIFFQKYVSIPTSVFIILGFISIYALLLQIGQIHQKRKFKKNPPIADYTYQPYVSILIPAHNEENVIEDTIQNVFNLFYDKYEVIVIDDRSTDNTASVLKRLENKYEGRFKCFTRPNDALPGKSAVLNEAVEISQGEVICVFDADARIKPDFLNKILPYLADEDTGAVQARKVILNSDTNFLTRCQNNEYALDAHFQKGRDSIKGAVELRGNGQLIKIDAIKDVGGWNNYTITDDLDLSTRLHLKGWDIRFCTDVEVYEEGILSFMPLLRQRRRWVEGSIRRYLDYFVQVIFSKEISLRVSLDMWAYISEFVLPVWLLSEWFIQGIKFAAGTNNNILSALYVIPSVCIFFIIGLIYGIRKYNGTKRMLTLIHSIETGIYMIVLWIPIVTLIVFKIIFVKRTMDWGKTDHGIAIEKAQSLNSQVNT